MPKRIALRLLALTLVLSVGLFAFEAVGHWHRDSYDEQHCQVCHLGHVSVPQPSAQVRIPQPIPVARFAPVEVSVPSLETVGTHKIPRAPPA